VHHNVTNGFDTHPVQRKHFLYVAAHLYYVLRPTQPLILSGTGNV